MHHPTNRRSVLKTGVLSLAVLSPLVSRFTQDANAKKNTGKTAAQRANQFIAICFELGGEPTVDAVKRGGVTITCDFGSVSETCTATSKKLRCHSNAVPAIPGDLHDLEPAPTDPIPGDVPTVPLEPAGSDLTPTSKDGTSRNRRKR